jgi:hypothetical protein
MKKVVGLLMAVLFVLMLGTAQAAGIGTAAVSIDGNAGVTAGTYSGTQYSGEIGLHGSNLQGSIAITSMQGVQMGTSAYGSVDVTSAFTGNVGDIGGTGTFYSAASGGFSASQGSVSATGSYNSSSLVTVSGSF